VISTRNLDPAPETLARRALYVTLSLALASSTSGVLAARVGMVNDAACAEFSVDRATALNQIIFRAAPGFFSESMLKGLELRC
jgi:hypothetical protein